MSDVEMWSLVVGFLSPPVMAILQQPTWTAATRAVVAFLWSVVAGGVMVWLSGAFEGKTLVTSILMVFVSAISSYKMFWQPTGVAPAIEAGTSPK